MSREVGVHNSSREVRVEVGDPRNAHAFVSVEKKEAPRVAARNEFVYVNSAFVGSLNSVHDNRLREPPTSVIREQYWACSKWPFGQKFLAIAVGVLLGAVIGLAVTLGLGKEDDIIGGIFRSAQPAPD